MLRFLLLQSIPTRRISSSTAFLIIALSLLFVLTSELAWQRCQVVLVKECILRGVAFAAFVGMYSLFIQQRGLLGQNGLCPISSTLRTVNAYISAESTSSSSIAKWGSEMVLTFLLRLVYEKFNSPSDLSHHLKVVMKVDLALALLATLFPHPLLLVYLWLSYYGYKRVSGPFLNFQWDILLLESLAAAISLALSPSGCAWLDKLCLWSFKILLLRLMLGSGLVKAYGRDPSWHKDYTAMTYHFYTQPLPSMIGHIVHQSLPKEALKVFTILTLISEVHVPLAMLFNVRVINVAVALGSCGLMIVIASTGHYGFFNFLTMILSMALLDDVHLLWLPSKLLPSRAMLWLKEFLYTSPETVLHSAPSVLSATTRGLSIALSLLFLLPVVLSHTMALLRLVQRCNLCIDENLSGPLAWLDTWHDCGQQVAYLGNHYGLFANMTKQRKEVIIELSTDQQDWHPIRWRYKPDLAHLPPKLVTPLGHMPRLDWVMWFLAFKSDFQTYPKWAVALLISLLEGNEDVLSLLHPSTTSLIHRLKGEKRSRASAADSSAQSQGAYLVGDDGLWVRVSLADYSFCSQYPTSNLRLLLLGPPNPDSEDEIDGVATPAGSNGDAMRPQKDRYWEVGKREEVLPPMDLQGLYRALDALFTPPRSRPVPSAETAQQIIMRTLFRKQQQRKDAAKTANSQE